MHPGYKIPDRKQIANELLDETFQEIQKESATLLNNEIVCLSIDGWANIKRDPIICSTITNDDGRVFLVDTVNTEDQPHTSSNLLKITKMSKELAEQTFSCKVASFVTDTAANMKKMREELQNESEGSSFDIISYGCSCHALNLLAHDFVNADRDKSKVLSEVVNIIKFFRNHNLPNFWYKDAGGKELIMPIDVRWNSHCGSLQSYIDNWAVLTVVCEKYRLHDSFDANICI